MRVIRDLLVSGLGDAGGSLLDLQREVGLMEERSASLWDSSRVDLTDRDQQLQSQRGEQVAQLARLPRAGLYAVDHDRDRAMASCLFRDLVHGRASEQVEVSTAHAASGEASGERRPEPFLE
jgi:hypothetical protein